jgi:hypothetical protein
MCLLVIIRGKRGGPDCAAAGLIRDRMELGMSRIYVSILGWCIMLSQQTAKLPNLRMAMDME